MRAGVRSGRRALLAAAFMMATVGGVAVVACGGGDSSNSSDGDGCASGQTSCGGTCVDTMRDRNNCGSCAMACDPTTLCSLGACVAMCPPSDQVCTFGDGGAFCTNTQSDNANCGKCGHACGAQQSCSGGACASACGQGQVTCTPDGAPAYCASVASDNLNCGSCGHACGAAQVCSAGKCSSECVSGQTLCGADSGGDDGGAYCADTQTDNSNCGQCGKTCGVQEQCIAATCASTCAGNQTLCIPDGGIEAGTEGGPFCTDLHTDNANCGACGNACIPQDVCTGGVCKPPMCVANQTLCDADGGTDGSGPYCANLQTDNANCGACHGACIPQEVCTAGVCKPPVCVAGQTLCDADGGADGSGPYCANLQTDNANCGACHGACPLAQPLCASGVCLAFDAGPG
jgi:hypothetical protein